MTESKFITNNLIFIFILLAINGNAKAEEEIPTKRLSSAKRLERLEKQIAEIYEPLSKIEFSGNIVGYYQGANLGEIQAKDFASSNGAGFAANLELSFLSSEKGAFYLRLHAGKGNGVDSDIEEFGLLYTDLNTINDDNPDDGDFDLLEIHYTQEFQESLALTIGKTEPSAFIDDNAFANDESTQFVGKAFVNSPMLDSEDEYAPTIALEISPTKSLKISTLAQSTSRPLLDEREQKDEYDDIFNDPMLATQIKFSPKLGERQGNYRLFAWMQTYDHPEILGSDVSEGWGVGLSLDQKLSETIGVFGRFAYSDKDVYEIPTFLSAGLNFQNIIYKDSDEMGIGFASLLPNDDLEHDDPEMHVEVYYRYMLSKNFSISPHFQMAINPEGNRNNDNIMGVFRNSPFCENPRAM